MLYREEINDGLILKSEVFFQVGSNRNNYGFSARFDLSPEKSDYYSNPERIDRIRQIATERLIKSLHSIHPLDIDQERSNEVNYSHMIDLIGWRRLSHTGVYFSKSDLNICSSGESTDDSLTLKCDYDFFGLTLKAILGAYYEELNIEPKFKIFLEPKDKDSDDPEVKISVENIISKRRSVNVGFEAIAGQDEAVAEAKSLVHAMKNPEVFKKRGVKIPKGIMFYGPPGNGKTMLVEAIAKESGSEFIEISSADINKKWHGQSEQMMQKVFDEATGISRGGKKVIVFFDDFDALALSRDESYPVERKVMAVILRNMDGLDTNPNVMVLAATNRIEDIDQAIKRSGRFDNLIEVGLPDEKGRIEIFKVHMAMAKTISTEPESQFSTTLDFNQIARETNGFSGADLANLINRVLKFKLTGELEGKGWTPVTTNDVLDMAYKIGIERTEKVAVDFSKKK